MIYLIDDTPLHKVGAEFILEHPYNTVIRLVRSQEEYELIDDLESASCICVHRTFCNSDETKNDVSYISEDGDKIPLIVFSAGDNPIASYNPQEAKNWISGIKKGVFYSRFKAFIDNYLTTNFIDISQIAYGESKSFQELRPLCLLVLQKLEATKPYQTDLIERILCEEEFKEIVQIANPALKISHVQILAEYKSKKISSIDLKTNLISILSSFEKYGKNIYPWK